VRSLSVNQQPAAARSSPQQQQQQQLREGMLKVGFDNYNIAMTAEAAQTSL